MSSQLTKYFSISSKKYLNIIIRGLIVSIILYYGYNSIIVENFKLKTEITLQSTYFIVLMYLFATSYLIELLEGILIRLNGIWNDTILLKSYVYYIATQLPISVSTDQTIDKNEKTCDNSSNS